jgi:hypothetical protein
MSYRYKIFDIPEYREMNWHDLVVPILEWTIDNGIIMDYKATQLEEIDNIVYVLKINSRNKWMIKKVVSNLDETYTTTYATELNNPSYTNEISAFNNKQFLIYTSDYNNLLQ